MKSFFLLLLLCTVGSYVFAQWNPNNQTTGSIYYNGGNVGIGESNPNVSLVVKGIETQTTLGQNSNSAIRIINGYGAAFGRRSELQFALSQMANETLAVIAGEYSTWDGNIGGDLVFATTPTSTTSLLERMRINSRGYVGIGTTAPSFFLDVRGPANSNVAFFGTDLSQVNSPFPSQVSVWGTGVNSESRIGFGTTLPGGTTGHTAMIKSVVPGNGGGHLVFQTREPNYNSLVERLVITNIGNTGIGTSTPNTLLAVSGNDEDLLHLSRKTNAAGDNVYMVFSHGDNTASANARAKIGVNIKPGGAGRLVFHTGYSNTLMEQMRIDEVGNVGIGTINPTQKLTVNGTVYSKEVKVDVSAGTGPDYVFEPTYQLPSLNEIESYIKANKHLPEVPSAKEMETNGINLSEMNMLLLKKVEELTLHLIEQQKQLHAQQELIEKLLNK